MKKYDTIIIGAGHNGLVAAAYLARAGQKVLVLERRHVIGGGAVTEEIHPGFQYSTCAAVCGMLEPHIVRELKLKRYGLELLPLDPNRFTPLPEGGYLLMGRDPKETAKEIERFSRADAARFLPFTALIKKLTGFLRPLLSKTLPQLGEGQASSLFDAVKLGWRFHRLGKGERQQLLRILPMSVADFLGEWFETDALKATLAANGILGAFLGPRAQGTAYLFLYHHAGAADGEFGPGALVRGGVGNLSRAIARAAEDYGVEIRPNSEVAQILMRDDAAAGVVLKDGTEISSAVVASAADVQHTFLKFIDPLYLDPRFLHRVRNLKLRGACAKVNLALSELPDFKCLPGSGPHQRALIHVGPTTDYLERAFDDAKYGGFSKRPFLEIVIPSLTDPSLAPEGKHVMSILMQYAPYHLKEGGWGERREELGDLVVDTVSEYAPNFKNSILHRQVLTPLDLEEIYGFAEGNIHHGELSLDQLFFMRPVPGWAWHRTPIPNLYLCGSGTHPGGGITGIPGRNAAGEILKDRRRLKS